MHLDISELETHRTALLRFALLQLHNKTHAEDVVQETMVAALQGADRFAGGSSVRTWLVGILKHKILDHYRAAAREQPLSDDAEEFSLDDFDPLFKEDGHFVEQPTDWDNPENALVRNEFFEILETCLEALPRNTARVFTLREIMGVDTEDICRELSISANNCWVLLYRARMSLRTCLEQRWFGPAGGTR
jgi:RNA polymerase sigma-70 factor (ECF subfamily)